MYVTMCCTGLCTCANLFVCVAGACVLLLVLAAGPLLLVAGQQEGSVVSSPTLDDTTVLESHLDVTGSEVRRVVGFISWTLHVVSV